MNTLKKIIGLFSQPNDFQGDPYGHITNQLGHAWLGNAISAWVIWVSSWFGGSYPDQITTSFMCIFVYFTWWELGWQGWRKRDTIEDTLFFAFGTLLFFVLDMSQTIEISSRYDFFSAWRTIDIVAAFHLTAVILLTPGIFKRIKQGVT